MATAKPAKPQSQTENNLPVVQESAVPAFLQGRSGPARGSENVGMDDLVIPRLELVQALSPCVEEGNAAYIEGAKPGMLFNNVTRELFGKAVDVIPVYFKKEHIVWKNRKKGGGFVGAFPTEAEAEACRLSQEIPEDYQVNDTANHFCLLINPVTGKMEEIVVSMAVTKLKVSRQWNSLIRINGGDSFTRVYTIGTVLDENKDGEKFHNLSVKGKGFVTEEQFRRAESLYETVAAGNVSVNRDTDVAAPATGGDSEY